MRWLILNYRFDPTENCHLNVKKIPKSLTFFQKMPMAIIWKEMIIFVKFLKQSQVFAFFDVQMAIFRRVSYPYR